MNPQSELVESIDALLKFIHSCGTSYSDVQEIPSDGLAEFYRLDQRVYDLAKSAGLLDRLPDRSALDREWNVDGVSVPVRFEGKTNLPADWDNNALMVYAKGGWTADMLALRTLASIGLVPAVPSSDPPADTETPAPPEAVYDDAANIPPEYRDGGCETGEPLTVSYLIDSDNWLAFKGKGKYRKKFTEWLKQGRWLTRHVKLKNKHVYLYTEVAAIYREEEAKPEHRARQGVEYVAGLDLGVTRDASAVVVFLAVRVRSSHNAHPHEAGRAATVRMSIKRA